MPGTAAPVAPHERQPLIDALRGLALAGVLMANLGYLSLYDFTGDAARAALPTAAFDLAVLKAMELLVSSKAITLFSLLFGLGFAIQLERAQARGAGGLRHYLQRLGWLLIIGLAHSYLIWWGDILTIYAVVGLLLVLFRHAPDRWLLWGGLFIAVLLPGLIGPWLNSVIDGESQRSSIYARSLLAFVSDSWRDTFAANTALVHWTRLMNWSLICFVLGRFLIGYWAGRRQLLQRAEDHLPLLRRILIGALAVAIVAGALLLLCNANPDWREHMAGRLLRSTVFRLAPLALAIAYAAGFVLLFQRAAWRRVLMGLALLGRMALTNYLMQSVLGIFLFYGIGLGIGPWTGLTGWLLAWFGILAAQIAFSHFWLARFRYGPCEWAWRSLTYGKLQPIRRPRVALAS
ncbi:DUF418 domain-containing protein [Pseudoxanthomonas indica]|uniref:DUF418 domain-containing protein n=1 Tax=Pseudoxanthomonas indica TaxID=428993 RepID=A0A1T5JX00_9GAMM|nr:DUF418 domain-containing protein [Pseudoxanthomonas indica]GGD45134.1 membrane protein [Pseudoxanthomonas indica]SKC56062.1 uncharacterized protein SAMN06296058_1170 [Pseudoxanthomonas indica]